VCRVAEVVSCGEVHFERHVSVGLVFFFTRLSLDAICHTVDLWLLDCHQRSSTQTSASGRVRRCPCGNGVGREEGT
jgi:hypothetical protein